MLGQELNIFLHSLDYKAGFGGKFGIQKDRVDKSAIASYDEQKDRIGTNYERTRPDGKLPQRSKFDVIYLRLNCLEGTLRGCKILYPKIHPLY